MTPRSRTTFRPALVELEPRAVPSAVPVSADPVPAGQSPNVVVRDAGGAVVATIAAYEPGMTGGVRVAIADLTGDGVMDIVTAPGAGGGPRVRVFDGTTFAPVADYFAYDPAFRGGVSVAAGALGGGTVGVATGAGTGGAPHVRVFTPLGAVVTEFFAHDPADRGGATVDLGTGPDGSAVLTASGAGWSAAFDPRTGTAAGSANGQGRVGAGGGDKARVGPRHYVDDDGYPDGDGPDVRGDPDEEPDPRGLPVDLDGDGEPDGFGLDLNGDGIPDATELDLDGDGEPDPIDWNGDGVTDGIAIDTNGDGIPDGVGYDLNGDGVTDGVGLDGDGDGMIDGVDTDGDGQSDAVGIDIDGDGVMDGLGIDADGDGEADGIDLDGDGDPDGVVVDFNGDGEPDAVGIDTDGDGKTDSFDPDATQPISTTVTEGGEPPPPDPAPGPSWFLGIQDVEQIYNELIKAGKEDVAYWLAWQPNIKLKQYEPSSTVVFGRTPPDPKVSRNNGVLTLEFRKGETAAVWAAGLIAHVESGDSREYNRYYYEFMVTEPDINNPNLAVGDSIRPDNKAWVREVLQRGPGIMAGAAFGLALDVLPLGGAGKVLANMTAKGFRLTRQASGTVIKKVFAAVDDVGGAKLGEVLAETRLGQIIGRVTGLVGVDEAAEWVGRFCFAPDTLVATERGRRPISAVEPGDRVWAYAFELGRWVLSRVAQRNDGLYDGVMVKLGVDGSTTEMTADHPVWIVTGDRLPDRPYPAELIRGEDEHRSLAGRWVSARDVQAGDVVRGRDGRVRAVEAVTRRDDGPTPVCNLAIDQHASFAVGSAEFLVHNSTCWKSVIESATGQKATRLINRGLEAMVHGHHIVMKTLPNDVRRQWIEGAQNILKSYAGQDVLLLAKQTDVTAFVARARQAGRPVELHNLCFAANSFKEIHSEKYAKTVFQRLSGAEYDATAAALRFNLTAVQTQNFKAAAIKAELRAMADIMEAGNKFW